MRLRRSLDADQAFVRLVQRSTLDHLPDVGLLLDAQVDAFLAGVTASFPAAECSIIEHDGAPIGTLHIDHSGERLHVIDLALLAPARGSGIGTAVLTDLQCEGRAAGWAVTLNVLSGNIRAQALYQRLGFEAVADRSTPPHVFMQWQSGSN